MYTEQVLFFGLTHNPRMRTAPTLVVSSGTSHFRMRAAGASQDLDTCVLQETGPSFSQIKLSLPSPGITTGCGAEMGTGDGSAYLAWSAEL